MFNLKFIYPIGIDIGNQNIYAAQFKQTRQGLAVRGLVHRELNGGGGEDVHAGSALVPALKEISKNKQFHGKRVVVHLPSQYIFSFPIRFQVGDSETLEEAIFRESKEYLSFPIEEAILDYPSIVYPSSGDSNEYKTTIIAIHRNHIDQYLQILKQAGLIVDAVDFGISSLIRLHHHLYNATDNPVILCNIDNTESLISVVTRDSILAERHVRWGIETLQGRLRANLVLQNDKDNAKFLLEKYGLLFIDRESSRDDMDPSKGIAMDEMYRAIYQVIAPYIEELIDEFHKVIAYLMSEEWNTVVEGIYLYGQATSIHHLDGYFKKQLDIPTKLINPMTKVAVSRKNILHDVSEGASFSLALGLAMRKVTWL